MTDGLDIRLRASMNVSKLRSLHELAWVGEVPELIIAEHRAIRGNIAEALDIVIQIERRHGQRFISEALQIKRYSPDDDRYDFQILYRKD